MQVQEVMSRSVQTLGPEATVRQAALLMRDDHIGSIPIVDDGKVLGILTDRDIAVRVIADDFAPGDMPVREVMSSGTYTVHADDDVAEAAEMMARHQVKRLPVVDDDEHLVGIVTLGDLGREDLNAAKEALGGISEPTESARR